MEFNIQTPSGKSFPFSSASETVAELKTEIGAETVGFISNDDQPRLIGIDLIKASIITLVGDPIS